jgi:hypothetical protein
MNKEESLTGFLLFFILGLFSTHVTIKPFIFVSSNRKE